MVFSLKIISHLDLNIYGSGFLLWGQPFRKMFIKTKIEKVLDYVYQVRKLI